MKNLDSHGQPSTPAFNAARIKERDVDELIGCCRGVLADGEIVDAEARFLLDWLESHRMAASTWPVSRLYERLQVMLKDRKLDLDEQSELLELLHDLTGGGGKSTPLPLCRPAPEVTFSNKLFCPTGRFVFGTRKECEAQIVQRGGAVQPSVTTSTAYLVIGTLPSSDWLHSTHGTKIQQAVKAREQGRPIRIIDEEHWVRSLSTTHPLPARP